MSTNNAKSVRVSNAIETLINHLIPNNPNEDNETKQERHNQAFDLAHSIIDQAASSALSPDVGHASDLIKKKLIQSNPTQALRYTSLYSRLLSLPVLNQKWAILYLLYELADSPDPNEPLPLSPLRKSAQRGSSWPFQQLGSEKGKGREKEEFSKASTPVDNRDETFTNAFAPNGLRKFPPDSARRGPDEDEGAGSAGGSKVETSPKKATSDVALKSAFLADSFVETEPPEGTILSDLRYTLQGVESKTMPFSSDGTILNLPNTLPPPLVGLLHKLAEPALLYQGIATFLKSPRKGLLDQSFGAAIDKDLGEYLEVIGAIETQIRRALHTLDESAPRQGLGSSGVTLKRCLVWMRSNIRGLRFMSLLAEESKNKHGGQVITLIHRFSSHGDPEVEKYAERLLVNVTQPFYNMLRRWIYDGELSDPHLEFFVQEKKADSEAQKELKSKGLASVWNSKFEVVDDMVPSIITVDFAQKVFLIGKSLHFIRHSCSDSQWVNEYSKNSSKELRYGDTATLEAWIDEAYKTTMQRLIELMSTKFHLFDHLQALKDYTLLGKGDFVALLMESLAANLDRPANVQYRHTLTAQLENAIRGSNAQYDSQEVLKRLDARMLQLSHGDIGWDCFTLEYKIDAPVDVVVTDWGSRQYLKVFNFLWRIKRVEFALSNTWRKCMTGARGVLQTTDESVLQTWKQTRGTLAEMVHFVGQLQYYLLFEVIESSWTELQNNVHKDDCTLDDLIRAHEKYLRAITHKGLLGARRRQHEPESGEDRHSYMNQLGDLLGIMLVYCESVDGLYSWAVADFTERQQAGMEGDRRSNPIPDNDELPVGGDVHSEFPALRERLPQIGASFTTRLQMLLGDLAYQPDIDMRFLGVAMNFNDVYQPVRRKSRAATATGGGAGAGTVPDGAVGNTSRV